MLLRFRVADFIKWSGLSSQKLMSQVMRFLQRFPLPSQHVFSVKLLCFLVLPSVFLLGCGVIRKKEDSKPSSLDIVGKPMPPEQARAVLSEIGQNFTYGPGLGDAALNVGTVVVFPPYAIYLLGNAVLSLSGYEPVTVASLLPEEDGKKWSKTYDSMVSGPGKVVAAVAGREYRSQEVGEEKLRAVLASSDLKEEVKVEVKGDK